MGLKYPDNVASANTHPYIHYIVHSGYSGDVYSNRLVYILHGITRIRNRTCTTQPQFRSEKMGRIAKADLHLLHGHHKSRSYIGP
jgi:hypothetical protein